jgi:hypothetical protein
MQNRKKLAPTLFLVLALALAPHSWAGEPATLSLGPLEWLKVWIASLLEEASGVPQPEADHCEGGPLIIPSG